MEPAGPERRPIMRQLFRKNAKNSTTNAGFFMEPY